MKFVPAVLLASLFAFTPGCLFRASGSVGTEYYVEREPPPPRHVVVVQRPGQIWVDGYWRWSGGDWAWVDGSYQARREGNVYVQGRWVQSGKRWKWTPGRWNASASNDRGKPGKARGHHKN